MVRKEVRGKASRRKYVESSGRLCRTNLGVEEPDEVEQEPDRKAVCHDVEAFDGVDAHDKQDRPCGEK